MACSKFTRSKWKATAPFVGGRGICLDGNVLLTEPPIWDGVAYFFGHLKRSRLLCEKAFWWEVYASLERLTVGRLVSHFIL